MMKKLYFVLMAFIVLASCKKSDSGPSNNITYDGKANEITKGYLENYGIIADGMYNFDLTLVSKEITMTQTDISGVGNAAYFEMISNSPTELAAGTYTFSASVSTSFTFDLAYVGLDYDIANASGTLPIVGGTVVIKKDGANYDITINCVTASAKSITGNYTGTLIAYDQTN
jgi:hypothetical protein